MAKAHVTSEDRAKHGERRPGREGKFPIDDKTTALNVLKLRGHAKSEAERASIINRAAKYVPEAAAKAREADKKRK